MNWNPLIVSPSPRDIEVVKSALMDCPYDIMYAKYFPIKEAMMRLRDYFLAYTEYTHLIYATDDLVIRPSHIECLKKSLDVKDRQYIAGVCNVDIDEHKDYLAITHNLPHPTKNLPNQLGWRWYHWYHKDDVEKGLMRVWHSGNACAIFRRDLIEQIPFEDDRVFNKAESDKEHGSIDVMFSNALARKQIQQVVDTDCRMLHMRNYGKIDIYLHNGFMEFHDKAKRRMENTVATY